MEALAVDSPQHMVFSRRLRLFTALFSLWALLWTQSAIAAYTCPALAEAAELVAMSEAGTPCAEMMAQAAQEDQPALCAAHCHPTVQSADAYQVPAVAAPALLMTLMATTLPEPSTAANTPSPDLRRSTSPPLSVRHCCLRI
jgi:hypothetical protein